MVSLDTVIITLKIEVGGITITTKTVKIPSGPVCKVVEPLIGGP